MIIFGIWCAIGFVNWLLARTFFDWWINQPAVVIFMTLLGPALWLAWLISLSELIFPDSS